MKWIVDPIKGRVLVDDYVADLVECEIKNRGFGIDASDRRAFSGIHRGMPPSANVTPVGAPKVTTAGEPVKPSGWVDPLPLGSPPGVALADRIVDAQDQRDRVEAGLRRRLKP
jgi:hypothetical protein